ncbi:hypothetical protein NC653_036153 [Populus alba x Populus x berolinensis]|uniref:Uncharacterized protein n=1 Tax=Populus alba x Populus x berolinensis TaxID=444605 RepID=A0AAD6LJ62_9ROSI|nr:hypothetical protein NC653_036153 [Populus alba x Populus x berolinensis]
MLREGKEVVEAVSSTKRNLTLQLLILHLIRIPFNSSSSGSRPFNFFRESDSPRSNGEATEPLHRTHPYQTYSSSGCNLQFPGCHISHLFVGK